MKKEKMNTAVSMSKKILDIKSGGIMQLNLIDYKELTQTAWEEELTKERQNECCFCRRD